MALTKGHVQERAAKRQLFVLYTTLFAMMGVMYVYYIVPVFGFDIYISTRKVAVATCVLWLFVASLPLTTDSRAFNLNLALTINLVPSLVLYALGNQPIAYAAVIWMALAIVFLVSSVPVARFGQGVISLKQMMWLLAIATFGFLVVLIRIGGLSNFNLDVRKVYEFRDLSFDTFSGVLSYLIPSLSKILMPFGVVISLKYRKYVFSILFFLSAIFMFGVTSNKGIVFYPLVSVGIFYLMRVSRNYSMILKALLVLMAVSFVDAYLSVQYGDNALWGWIVNLCIRRAFMTPAILDYHYIEFFSNNPWVLWATSKLSLGLVSNPYPVTAPFVIGLEYFGKDNISAGTGFIGSGFAQAGIYGTILYSVFVGMILSLLRSFEAKLGFPVMVAIMTSLILTMYTASDLVALFLTHGMLLALFLLWSISPAAKPKVGASETSPRVPNAAPPAPRYGV